MEMQSVGSQGGITQNSGLQTGSMKAATAGDNVSIGGSPVSTQVDISTVAGALKGMDPAAALRDEISKLYDDLINDDNYEAKFKNWETIIEKTKTYLTLPESFPEKGFGPLSVHPANDPGVRFVSVSAPRPQIAGTMAQNWNFLQWKDPDGTVHVQQLGEEDPDLYTDGRVWQHGDKTRMTSIGFGKADSRHIYPFIKVFEKGDGEWKTCNNMFVSNVTHIEGHELCLTPDGSLYFENDYATDNVLEVTFDGQGNDVKIDGKKTSKVILKDGRYSVASWEEEEKKEKLRQDMEALRKMDEASRKEPGESRITTEENEVNIGGVKLPIREY